MLTGPLLTRELITTPRRPRHYLMRAGFVASLLILLYSIRQATIGFQDVLFAQDVAAFSSFSFSVLSLLLLTVGIFFSTVISASAIAQEKDRRTLILLLMTDLKNSELVLGKLSACLLNVLVMLVAVVPVFAGMKLLGGISWQQIAWSVGIIGVSMICAGCWGCLVAFRQQKTFQTLSVSVLGIILFLAAVDGGAALLGTQSAPGSWLAAASPYRAMFGVLNPLQQEVVGVPDIGAAPTLIVLAALAVLLCGISILRLRVWNPSQALRQSALQQGADAEPSRLTADESPDATTRTNHRPVWDQAVLWKEIVTRGYGRRVFWIKLGYLLLAALICWASVSAGPHSGALVLGMVSPAAAGFLGLCVLSLLLINVQAVTSVTTERDSNTLDILLATDLKPPEFMRGKIFGAAWNAREMIAVPLIVLVILGVTGTVPDLTVENMIYGVITLLVLSFFSIMLGLHAGLSYHNSRSAVGNSLGTMFFLFVGILVFMLLLVEARSSFAVQMQSFIVFMGLGSLGLLTSLTYRSPSSALGLASLLLPFLTFYAVTDFLLGGSLGVCFWICVAYGFTATAMLIPSLNDYDIALGRNTAAGR